jgi:flavodoxin
MTKVLILYYSAYGHMERMAEAVAEGVREQALRQISSACRNWSPKRSQSNLGISLTRKRRL